MLSVSISMQSNSDSAQSVDRAASKPIRFGLKSVFVLTAAIAVLAAGASAGGAEGFFLAAFLLGLAMFVWGLRLNNQSGLTGSGCLIASASLLMFLLCSTGTGARPAHLRNDCQNNLQQIGLALLNYHDKFQTLPPFFSTDQSGKLLHSWRTVLLPDIEEAQLYTQFALDKPWNHPLNKLPTQATVSVYQCSADSSLTTVDTSYVAIIGPGTAWSPGHATKLTEITDGPSNTILLVEMHNSGIAWAEPRDLDLNNLPPGITSQNLLTSLANHSGIVNALFADGHVEGIPVTLPWSDFMALLTIAGGETVDRSKW